MASLIVFFSRRWHGQVPLSRLLWRDMIGIGTFINVLVSVAVLILMAQRVDMRIAVALHFSPMAYNLFLALAVWRSPQRTSWTSSVAFAWLALMTVV